VRGGSLARARCWTFVLTLRGNQQAARARITEATYTSKGYMSAHELTPATDPHMNGANEGGMGNHAGVIPCSPVTVERPIKLRIASYSMK
jgi:hypothetical protein